MSDPFDISTDELATLFDCFYEGGENFAYQNVGYVLHSIQDDFAGDARAFLTDAFLQEADYALMSHGNDRGKAAKALLDECWNFEDDFGITPEELGASKFFDQIVDQAAKESEAMREAVDHGQDEER